MAASRKYDLNPQFEWAGGGFISNSTDLARWVRALYQGHLFSPETFAELVRGVDTPRGGGYSTVEDLLRFADALQENKLLNAHYTALLTTGKIGTPDSTYAYGFLDHKINETRCFGHSGGAPGMNGDLEICPKLGYLGIRTSELCAGNLFNHLDHRSTPYLKYVA